MGLTTMIRTFDFNKLPIVDIVNEILYDSAKRRASDIHFDPREKFTMIRIRIDGLLHDYAEVPSDVEKNLITRIKIIAGMNITESRLPQDGSIKIKIRDINLDLRVSSLPTNLGEKVVIRILDYSRSMSGLESLDLSEGNYKKVLEMMQIPNGIILVTGATGSGKSTTVYSILQRLNQPDTNIITVEDPVEMEIEGVNQVQVNSEIGLTFASALRSILRQDPNIIMIGEIRDTETAQIAVRASITGHLVLSTIHTNNSLNTIERLTDMGVEKYLLASSLEGIISQKLARRLCKKCRKERKANDYEKELIKKALGKDIDQIWTAVGCDDCQNGYTGRIAIHEVLRVTQDIRDAISDGMPKDELRKLVYSRTQTLLQDGLEKALSGETTIEEILKLIELDVDDVKEEGELSLKDSMEESKISKENEKVAEIENLKEQVIESEEKKEMTPPLSNITNESSISAEPLF